MNKYNATFSGRKVGSIGITYVIQTTVDGIDKDDATINLYKDYEHISGLSLTKSAITLTHFLEPTDLRRIRLGTKTATGQCLCSNGSYHAIKSSDIDKVDCPKCLELFEEHYVKSIHSK